MRPFDDDGDDLLAFLDTMFNVSFIFLAMFVLVLLQPHLKAEEAIKHDGVNPGRMCATLMWPDALKVDVDLWGRDPSGEVIFYRHRAGRHMDLLRDDLGNDPDPASHHFETMCARSTAAGSWTFNAVYYASRMPDGSSPDVPVSLEVAWPNPEGAPRPPIKSQAVLRPGEEATLLDFRLDGSGEVVPSSTNHLLSSMMR